MTVTGGTVILFFDQALADQGPASAFSVKVGGNSFTATSANLHAVNLQNIGVRLTTGFTMAPDETVTVTYTKPSSGNRFIQNSALEQADSIPETTATNNTTTNPWSPPPSTPRRRNRSSKGVWSHSASRAGWAEPLAATLIPPLPPAPSPSKSTARRKRRATADILRTSPAAAAARLSCGRCPRRSRAGKPSPSATPRPLTARAPPTPPSGCSVPTPGWCSASPTRRSPTTPRWWPTLAWGPLWLNGSPQVPAGIAADADFEVRDPKLRDVRDFADPDPRPKADSPALTIERKGYIGAFGRTDNWLKEWTVFGPESVYDIRQRSEDEN